MSGSRQDPDWLQQWGLPVILLAVWTVIAGWWLALRGGAAATGQTIPANPFNALLDVIQGHTPWPGLISDLIIVGEVAVLAGLGFAVYRLVYGAGSRTRVDGAARHLGRGRDLAAYTDAGTRESARRLRPGGVGADPAEHGTYLGETITGMARTIRAGWEDTIVLIAGPRIGKTSSLVIRQLIEAPGPALITTVRRDVWDATTDIRGGWGHCWNFDPQRLISDADPGWWFDPFHGVGEIDDARSLAGHFAAGTPGAGGDARYDYFSTEGEHLVACLLFAASFKPSGTRTLLDVLKWLSQPDAMEPVTLLTAAHQPQASAVVDDIRKINADKQKIGIYGFARSLMSCLENPRVTAWVTPPPPGVTRPRFDPDAFVRTRDTLYLHAKKDGNVGPLLAALVASVHQAGEARALRSRGGRLDPPLLSMLDEAGNICPLRSLPAKYSLLGGFGMPTITVLQSREQGRGVWGHVGFDMLWGAATVRIYLGGAADTPFLREVSELLGDYDEQVPSVSYNGQRGRATSYSTQRRPIMTVSQLAEMPRGRAVVLLSSARSAVIRTQPWTQTHWAPAIEASIAAHDPTAHDPTVHDPGAR